MCACMGVWVCLSVYKGVLIKKLREVIYRETTFFFYLDMENFLFPLHIIAYLGGDRGNGL